MWPNSFRAGVTRVTVRRHMFTPDFAPGLLKPLHVNHRVPVHKLCAPVAEQHYPVSSVTICQPVSGQPLPSVQLWPCCLSCCPMSLLRCSRTVGLLAVLLIVARCDVSQEQPSADLRGDPDGTLDQFWAFIGRAVKSATEPLITKLDSQQSQLDGVATKLSTQDSRMDSLNSRLDSMNSRLDGLSNRLDGISTEPSTPPPPPRDCSDLPAGARSGIHLVRPGLGRSEPVPAHCDLDTDGGNWTVFQRRADIQPRQNFYLGWAAYKEGFGELDAEFWWGLDHIWAMTSPRDRRYELRVDLEDFDGGRRHAVYQGFRLSSEADGFRLTAANYTGDAGDSFSRQFGQRFSTRDRDQDTWNRHCAQERKGAWWYEACHESNLNGQYLSGKTAKDVYGVNWKAWRGLNYSLKTVEMKIRPTMKSG